MPKDPRPYLEHILQSIQLIQQYISGHTKEEFFKSYELQDAIIRRVEIIGEAVKNLDDDLKKRNAEVPWREIVNMRNFLIHEYFDVNLQETWDTLQRDIPSLKEKVSKILSSLV